MKESDRIGDLVLMRNNQFIALNKPAGIPVHPDKSGDKSLMQLAEIYCKSKLYPINRLDRPASGIVLFAKTKGAVQSLNQQFRERRVKKHYLAIVQRMPPQQEGWLSHQLTQDKRKLRTVIKLDEEGNILASELHYQLKAKGNTCHLLEIELLTGFFHQIRAQLAAMGCPIRGDVKYGAKRGNPDRSICLHAWKLTFQHPVSDQEITLVAPPPIRSPWQELLCLGENVEAKDPNTHPLVR